MIEGRGGLGLVPQPLSRLEVVSGCAEQELDRDRAVELRVLGQEHLTHAARSEGAAELVMRDTSERLGHGGMRPAAGHARPRWRGEYTVD